MPRSLRHIQGGLVYHVSNCGNAGMTIFDDDAEYAAFQKVLCQAQQRVPMRILSYCLLPNHWHLLLWPARGQGENLSRFMAWLTVTHTRRWHVQRQNMGSGHVYQGRFKSFPIAADKHFLAAARYVERNALRAKLVRRGENWRWCSLWQRRHAQVVDDVPVLSDWPVARPGNWLARVNRPQTQAELEVLGICVSRGRPFGDQAWVKRTAKRLGLESSLRPLGRPRNPRNPRNPRK